jgi:HSP20 family protein
MTLMKFQKQPVRGNTFPAFNDLFTDLFDGMVNSDFRRWSNAAINIREDENNYFLEVAAPGVKKEDFRLNVEDNVLRIDAGTRKSDETVQDNGRYTRREFNCSTFSRSFTLPESVNIDEIAANYENGVMHIRLPKREEAKPKSREIAIN